MCILQTEIHIKPYITQGQEVLALSPGIRILQGSTPAKYEGLGMR